MPVETESADAFVHDAVLEFEYAAERAAAIVDESLQPEVGDIAAERTSASVERTTDRVTVTIRATDLVAVRAGVNTWTTLVGVAERCARAVPAEAE
jgi:KEOPS complex subunit Pcc1